VYEYTALQVKKSVVGSGHAKKEQVQEMVKRFLQLPSIPQADSADALACAMCHAHAYNQLQSMDALSYRMKKGRLV
jgi:crossover junction endodeoxyribonuclease RuvC